MRIFKWIEWNSQKIDAHGLSETDVESAFDRVYKLTSRQDGSYEMYAETAAGRKIWIIWRYDREHEPALDVLEAMGDIPIFVITAY